MTKLGSPEHLTELGFTYADKQKADTKSKIPKIDTRKPLTIEPVIGREKYPFLNEIAEIITLCRHMPIDPWKVSELCCQALENNIINLFTEEERK